MSNNIYINTNGADQQDLASICEKYPRFTVADVNYDFEAYGVGGLYIRIKSISDYDESGDQFLNVSISDVPRLIALIDRVVRQHDKEVKAHAAKIDADLAAGLIP